MSIFDNNIITKIPFCAILQTKYEEAVRRAAGYCWAQSIESYDVFERMVRWSICDVLGSYLYNNRDYRCFSSETGFEYTPNRNGYENVIVRSVIFIVNKRTGEHIGYQLEETVLIKIIDGSI